MYLSKNTKPKFQFSVSLEPWIRSFPNLHGTISKVYPLKHKKPNYFKNDDLLHLKLGLKVSLITLFHVTNIFF